MTSRFLDDGSVRYARAVDVELRREIEITYAGKLAELNWFRRFLLRRALYRKLSKAAPSKYSLW